MDNLDSTPATVPDPEALFREKQRSDAIRKCLAFLPTNQRLAIVLRHYEGMSYNEIAEVLKVSPKAVDSLLQRARDTLRRGLADV